MSSVFFLCVRACGVMPFCCVLLHECQSEVWSLYNTDILGETIETFVFVDFEAAQVENEDMKTNSILHFLS